MPPQLQSGFKSAHPPKPKRMATLNCDYAL